MATRGRRAVSVSLPDSTPRSHGRPLSLGWRQLFAQQMFSRGAGAPSPSPVTRWSSASSPWRPERPVEPGVRLGADRIARPQNRAAGGFASVFATVRAEASSVPAVPPPPRPSTVLALNPCAFIKHLLRGRQCARSGNDSGGRRHSSRSRQMMASGCDSDMLRGCGTQRLGRPPLTVWSQRRSLWGPTGPGRAPALSRVITTKDSPGHPTSFPSLPGSSAGNKPGWRLSCLRRAQKPVPTVTHPSP